MAKAPMKLRDDIPVVTLNSQNAYELLDDLYLDEGLFFFLITPLLIGLGTSGKDNAEYLRG